MTIQLPHWTSGESPRDGVFPIELAGPPIQIAPHIPRVRVGVTNMRRKLDAEFVPSIHPAPIIVHSVDPPEAMALAASPQDCTILEELHTALASRDMGDMGHIIGIVIQYGDTPISIRVNALKVGIDIGPPFGLAHHAVPGTGVPNTDIGLPGAIGAQFRGKFIQPHHPNQQASPSTKF